MEKRMGRTVFVRNLNRKTTAQDLTGLFSEIGRVERCFVVEKDQVSRGYGFVTLGSLSDAEKAVRLLDNRRFQSRILQVEIATPDSATRIPRSRSADQCKARDLKMHRIIVRNIPFQCTYGSLDELFSKYGKIDELQLPRNSNGRLEGFAFVQFLNRDDALRAIQELNNTAFQGRTIVVDFTLSKAAYAEQLKAEVPDILETTTSKVSTTEFGDPENTFFVSNLHLDVTKQDLYDLFQEFGEIKYVKLVVDNQGIGRGSGFVCYRNKESFQKCLSSLDSIVNDFVDSEPGGGAILSEARWTIRGRPARIRVAQSRDQLQKQLDRNKNVDKRNLHLVKEEHKSGTMSKADREKRARSRAQRLQQLKNPNFHVSSKRLLVRNIPSDMDRKTLAQLAIAAVKNYRSILELSSEQPKIRLKQAKIVQNESGKHQGLNYGFVEFEHHQDALHCLQQMDNHSRLFTNQYRPIVEFAIEDARVLKLRERRLATGRSSHS